MLVMICRALRVTRVSLLAGELKQMHLSSRGALLSGAASVRLFQLIASVLTLLFTTSSIVSPSRLNRELTSCLIDWTSAKEPQSRTVPGSEHRPVSSVLTAHCAIRRSLDTGIRTAKPQAESISWMQPCDSLRSAGV